MPEAIKLDELEQYREEKRNAEREGRPCKYRNPREVYAENPNLDSYLVERDADELEEEQKLIDVRKENGETGPTSTYLADPGQEVAEALALQDAVNDSTHQQTQPTPNPENIATGKSVDELDEDEQPDIPGQTRDYTDEEKQESALPGPDLDSKNQVSQPGSVTVEESPTEAIATSKANPPNTIPDHRNEEIDRSDPANEDQEQKNPSALNDPNNSEQQQTTETGTRPDLDTI